MKSKKKRINFIEDDFKSFTVKTKECWNCFEKSKENGWRNEWSRKIIIVQPLYVQVKIINQNGHENNLDEWNEG